MGTQQLLIAVCSDSADVVKRSGPLRGYAARGAQLGADGRTGLTAVCRRRAVLGATVQMKLALVSVLVLWWGVVVFVLPAAKSGPKVPAIED